jgi:hypothetical protein
MSVKWVIPILFLILPFALIAPGLIWKSQQLFFLMLPVFIIAFSLKNKWVRWFMLYAGVWQLFLFIYSFNNPKPPTGAGLSYILSLMAGGIVFKFVSESTLPTEKWYTVLRIAVIMQVAISAFQFFGWSPVAWLFSFVIQVKQLLPHHLVGSIGNRNYLAAFAAFALPMFFIWRSGIFLPVLALLFLFCPSPATLAAIIGAAFWIAYRKTQAPGKILVYLSGAVLAGAGFTVLYVLTTGYHLNEFKDLPGQLGQFFSQGRVDFSPTQGDLGRFGMWLTALGHLISTPFGMVLGFGPGAFWGREYGLHSMYMATWFYFGLVGLFLLFGYIYTTWKFLWRLKDPILLTSFLIMCLEIVGDHSFEIATSGMMGVIILGLIERERLNG